MMNVDLRMMNDEV